MQETITYITDLLYHVGGYVCFAFLLMMVIGGIATLIADLDRRQAIEDSQKRVRQAQQEIDRAKAQHPSQEDHSGNPQTLDQDHQPTERN